MDARSIDKIKHIVNTEVVRRMLIQYFQLKGFGESFERLMYPSIIQDLPLAIPMLGSKIEVVPFASEIDPALGKAVIGWNMFVLGNHRMYLGETYHNNLLDLARQIKSGMIKPPEGTYSTARRQTTPKRVVSFITRILENCKAGYVDINPMTRPARPIEEPFRARGAMMGMGSGQGYFQRSAY